MCPTNNEKWKTEGMEKEIKETSECSEKRKPSNTREYCKWTPLNMLRSNLKKEYLWRTGKLVEIQTTKQKSHQKDKYLSCPPRKMLRTILKVDERRTLTNEPENKKAHDGSLGLTFKR